MNSPEDWLTMSDSERKAVRRKWNPYEGDGQDVALVVCSQFAKEKFLERIDVKDIHPGIHHRGTVVITVILEKEGRRDTKELPGYYLDFPVVYM